MNDEYTFLLEKLCQSIIFLKYFTIHKWDQILSLFPSSATLEEYNKRFDSRTKEGRMFYEKLSVFQAWFNLNSEINRLITVLGRIMACTQCQMWPVHQNRNIAIIQQ
jgi:hypothetical protein